MLQLKQRSWTTYCKEISFKTLFLFLKLKKKPTLKAKIKYFLETFRMS